MPKRIWKITPSLVLLARQAPIIRSARSRLISIGFSTSACLPALEAAIVTSACSPEGRETITTSTSSCRTRSR